MQDIILDTGAQDGFSSCLYGIYIQGSMTDSKQAKQI